MSEWAAAFWTVVQGWWQITIAAAGLIGLLLSLRATRRSLALTRRTLELQEEHFRRQNRPFVGVQTINVNVSDVAAEIVVRIKNTGPSPARVITNRVYAGTRNEGAPRGHPDGLALNVFRPNWWGSVKQQAKPTVFFADDIFDIREAMPFPDGSLPLLKNGLRGFFVAGEVIYEDMYGSRYRTAYAYRARHTIWGDPMMMATFQEGNEFT